MVTEEEGDQNLLKPYVMRNNQVGLPTMISVWRDSGHCEDHGPVRSAFAAH